MSHLAPSEALSHRLAMSGGPSFTDYATSLRRLMMQHEDLAVAMDAVKEYTKSAVGYAPTTSKSLQVHAKADKFFEAEVFENPPAPRIDAEND